MKTFRIKFDLLTYGMILIALMSSAILKSQNISTRSEIYDYDVGDIFHYNYSGYINAWHDYSISNIEIVNKYYSQNNDILNYVRDIKIKSRTSDNSEWTYEYFTDTLVIYHLDSLINEGNIDSVDTNQEFYNGRLINYFFYENPPDFTKIKRFVVGCGNAFDFWTEWGGNSGQTTELVYYKKGDEEWGTPMMVSVNDIKAKNHNLILFPNPAKSELTILTNNFKILYLEVYNISGELITRKNFGVETKKIDVSRLKNGLYILKIKTNDIIIYKKLIKESFKVAK